MIDQVVLADKFCNMQEAEIVDFLRENKITGEPGCEVSCVLANAFFRISGVSVEVMPQSIFQNGDFFCDMTQEMSIFIRNFDRGEYPELIDA